MRKYYLAGAYRACQARYWQSFRVSVYLGPKELPLLTFHHDSYQLSAGVAQALGEDLRGLDEQFGAYCWVISDELANGGSGEDGGLNLIDGGAGGVAQLAVEH